MNVITEESWIGSLPLMGAFDCDHVYSRCAADQCSRAMVHAASTQLYQEELNRITTGDCPERKCLSLNSERIPLFTVDVNRVTGLHAPPSVAG